MYHLGDVFTFGFFVVMSTVGFFLLVKYFMNDQ